MEKKWDTVIPADLKKLFVSGIYMFRWSRKGQEYIKISGIILAINVKTCWSNWGLRTLYLNKIFLPLGRNVW